VPAVRGPEVSRRPGDVIREVEQLASEGVVEVTLLGQNIDTYGRDLALGGRRRPIFAELLRRVGEVEGIRRIRFTSPHPADFRENVAQAMTETGAVCEQLHLPLQSGSDRILARMHRGYNARRFLDRLAMAHRIIPDLAVSTDIIVGFPGETDQDFDRTLEVVAEARFDQAFMFKFSARPNTAAAGAPRTNGAGVNMPDTLSPGAVQSITRRPVNTNTPASAADSSLTAFIVSSPEG